MISKYLRAITAAARSGGSADPAANVSLRNLIEAAKYEDVPGDNIDRLLARLQGGGEEGSNYEEIVYEGYAPGGVAVLVNALSDNRNRTASDVRHVFAKHGGSLGASGAVAWQFDRRGYLYLNNKSDAAQEAAIELGALDLQEDAEGMEVYTNAGDVYSVSKGLEARGFKPESVEITMVPQNTLKLSSDEAAKVLRLVEALEDLEDVQSVHTNLDPESIGVEA